MKRIWQTFNNHFVLEISSGIKTTNVAILSDIGDNVAATKNIIEIYKKHPVVIKSTGIIGNHNIKNYFQLKSVTKSYIATLLKETDIENATGVDKIPPKFVKLLVSIVRTKPCKTILPTYRVNYLT